MVTLLTIDHQLQFRELLRDRQHLLLVNLFVTCEERSSWLLLVIERVLSKTARIPDARDGIIHVDFAARTHRAIIVTGTDLSGAATWVTRIVRVAPRVLGQVLGEVRARDRTCEA